VTYRPSAENDLANIWLNAVDREAVAHAADEIDRLLGSKPLDVGEARAGSTRIIIERPLTLLYEVFPDDCHVSVHAISYWRRRKK
jgi:plasmid stabilization system protein ParE